MDRVTRKKNNRVRARSGDEQNGSYVVPRTSMFLGGSYFSGHGERRQSISETVNQVPRAGT